MGISSTQIYKVAEAAIATLAKASPGQQEIDEQPTGGISRTPFRLTLALANTALRLQPLFSGTPSAREFSRRLETSASLTWAKSR